MPIDKMISDPMLGTFRAMAQEVKDKGLEGEAVDNMVATLNRMEQLAEENDDLNQFNAQLVTEDLFNKFSQHYGAALASQAEASSNGDGGYDDAGLLQQTLDALRDAVKRIRDSKEQALQVTKSYDAGAATAASMDYVKRNQESLGTSFSEDQLASMKETAVEQANADQAARPAAFENTKEIETLFNDQALIDPIEDLIKLGEAPGMSLPKFLRLQIEQGLDKAMEGSAVARDALEYGLGWAQASMLSPHEVKMNEEMLAKFDELASAAPFGVPDSFEFKLARQKIEHKHLPATVKWNAVTDHWERLLSLMDHWITSYCSFAPFIDPWKLAKDPKRAVKKSQEVTPGEFKVREAIFNEYFKLTWHEIFSHETFVLEVQAHRIGYSQQWVELLKRCYDSCKPFSKPPDDCVKDAEAWFKEHWGDPESHLAAQGTADHYDNLFGKGRFEEKFGPITPATSKAAPWKL